MADDVSTRFPFINLEKALSRAQQLFDADKSGKPMLVPVAFEVWGYSAKSSGAFQTVGALKGYGLLTDEGANEDRRVQLTQRARRYFLDERDEIRAVMLAEFALSPPLFKALWDVDGWSNGVPADTVARSHLKLERNLNDQSARSLLSIFKENMQFAGLKAGAVNQSAGKADGASAMTLAKEPEGSNQPPANPPASAGAAPPPFAQGAKPIVFDMESVTVSVQIKTADDLRELIAKLQLLEPLLPSRE